MLDAKNNITEEKHFKWPQVSTTLPDTCHVKFLWLTKVIFMPFKYQAPLKWTLLQSLNCCS